MCSCVYLDPLSVLDKVPSSQADGYQPFLINGSTITVNNVVMGQKTWDRFSLVYGAFQLGLGMPQTL